MGAAAPVRHTRPLVATCHRGLEEILAGELAAVGAGDVVVGRGAVTFCGDPAVLFDALLWTRTAIRILYPLANAPVQSRDELYRLAERPRWEELVRPGQTIAVQAAGQTRGLANTAFACQVVKDAVVDRIRTVSARPRPPVERSAPPITFHPLSFTHLTRPTK